jgi:hypothetical protein
MMSTSQPTGYDLPSVHNNFSLELVLGRTVAEELPVEKFTEKN